MSTRDTTRSKTATIFNTVRKEEDSANNGHKSPSKCLKEEDDNPAFLVSEASTAALIADNLNKDQNFLITPKFVGRHTEQQATKAFCLKDRNARCQTHGQF